jgi:hypothetical protein
MSTLKNGRRRVVVLIVAAVLALTATYSPLLLDGLTGSALTPQAHACQHPGGGC